jgi:hypothetical protein
MTPEFLCTLANVDIDAWLGVEPEDLMLDPGLRANLDPRTAGARAAETVKSFFSEIVPVFVE